MPNLVGRTLGKYQIVELLGKGGMAEVYKAYHPRLNRYVCIKILHSYLAEGEDFLARFEREARAVATLRHPHIVQIHDFDVENDVYYMVMEYIDGGTLAARMYALSKENKYMPAGQVLSIVSQVAEALDYAHGKGIIHRDMKPSNILLDSHGNAFLADFGIARMMSGTQFTSTGALVGTPMYMSPEQGQGIEVTEATDIYSFGVILYELLTGKVPFNADTTPLAIIHKHITEPPPPPRSVRPSLPPEVEQVILKALAKDPHERHKSAGEMVRELEKALPPSAVTALETSQEEAPAPAVAPLPVPLPTTPVRPPEKVSEPAPQLQTFQAHTPPPSELTNAKALQPTQKSSFFSLAIGLGGLIGVGLLVLGLLRFLPRAAKARLAARQTATAAAFTPLQPTATPQIPTYTASVLTSTAAVSPTAAGPLYDSFDDAAFDGSFNHDLWMKVDNNTNSTVSQQEGVLVVDETTGYVNLVARRYSNFTLKQPIFVQAWIKMVSDIGWGGMDLSSQNFSIYCDLYSIEKAKGQATCFGGDGMQRLGKLDILSAQDWHILRIEVQPDTMTFTCTLDGSLIYQGTPPGALDARQADFGFFLYVSDNGEKNGHIIVNYDYVQAGLLK